MSEILTAATAFSKTDRPVDMRKRVERKGEFWLAKKGAFAATHFRTDEIEIADIYEAGEALDMLSASRAVNTAVLYGRTNERGRAEIEESGRVRRDYLSAEATFDDAPQSLHFLDIDAIALPDDYRIGDPLERLGEFVRSLLPPEFADVTLYISATGSHGCRHKSGADNVPRLRVAFWSARPISILDMKTIVERHIVPHVAARAEFVERRPLDLSIYSPGHLIFVLPPTSKDGEPYQGRRSAYIEGLRDEVDLPEVESLSVPEPENVEGDAQLVRDGANKWREKIGTAELLDQIETGSHEPVLALMARLGRRFPPGPELAAAVAELEPEIVDRIARSSKDVRDYDRRIREEISGGALYRSAAAYAEKVSARAMKRIEPRSAAKAAKPNAPQLEPLINSLVASALDERPARVDIVRAPPGTGKTRAALHALAPHIEDNRVLYLAPSHKLAAQTAANMRQLADPTLVRHYLGRRQPGVCNEPSFDVVARAAEDAGLSPRELVCKHCPLADNCSWMERSRDKGPGFISLAHAELTSVLGRIKLRSKKAPDLLVIDESAFSTLIESGKRGGPIERLTPDAVLRRVSDNGLRLWASADWLADRVALRDTLARLKPGRVEMEAVRHLFPRIEDAIELEQARRRELFVKSEELVAEMRGGDLAATPELAEITKENRASGLALACWSALRYNAEAEKRSRVKGLWREGASVGIWTPPKLPAALIGGPTLMLDATAEPELWRRMLTPPDAAPPAVVSHEVEAPPGVYHLTQYPDRTFSKTMLLGKKGDGRSTPRTAASWLWRLRAIIALEAAKKAGKGGDGVDVLVIAQKDVEEALKPLPANVSIAHFGDLRGLNAFERVASLILIGRPMPPMEELERMAEALTIADPTEGDAPVSNRYETAPVVLETRSKTEEAGAVEVEAQSHPDPLVALLMQEPLAEVIQAVGRARVTRRGEEDQCDLIVLGPHPTGLPIDEALSVTRLPDPSFEDIAEALEIVPLNPAALGDLMPGLAPESESARTRAVAAASLAGGSWPERIYEVENGGRRRRVRARGDLRTRLEALKIPADKIIGAPELQKRPSKSERDKRPNDKRAA